MSIYLHKSDAQPFSYFSMNYEVCNIRNCYGKLQVNWGEIYHLSLYLFINKNSVTCCLLVYSLIFVCKQIKIICYEFLECSFVMYHNYCMQSLVEFRAVRAALIKCSFRRKMTLRCPLYCIQQPELCHGQIKSAIQYLKNT